MYRPLPTRTLAAALAFALSAPAGAAEFVYHGQLQDRGRPAEGRYDLRIHAYAGEQSGPPLMAALVLPDVEVRDGRFEARFDAPLAKSNEAWLEVAVRDAGAQTFSLLPGRSKAVSAPLIGACWSSTGDAGSNPGTNFLGTTDAQAFVIRTQNVQSLRIEPSAVLSGGQPITANVIAGSHANSVSAGVRGATIGGGGVPVGDTDPDVYQEGPNYVADHYGTIGGGYSNHTGRTSQSDPPAPFATVGGGHRNIASGPGAAIAGGSENRSIGESSSIIGGSGNAALGKWSAVLGSLNNCAGGDGSMVAGHLAKTRPGSDPGFGPCAGMSNYPGGDGDAVTFVWADAAGGPFISTGSNQFLVRAQGGVGLGTNAPQNQLHVAEDVNDWAAAFNHVAQIQNTSTGSSPDVLALKIGTLGNPAGSVNFITFIRGDDTSLGTIEGDGAGGVTFAGPGNDYAEWLPRADADEAIGPGQIVGWTPAGIRLRTVGALRLMVVSTQPIVAGNAPMGEDRSGHAPVAFVGQAPVNVIGPVTAGDWIIASGHDDGSGIGVPGSKLAADQHALIVGRALESSTDAARKPIRTLIGLGQEALLGQLAADNAALRERVAQLESQQARIASLEARLAALTTPAMADAARH